MNPFTAIYRKELSGYFYSLTAYVFIIVFLTVAMWLTFSNLFLVGQTSMRGFFGLLPWFYLFLIPALTRRLWAEERRQGTAELLLTLPLPEWQAVAAKWAAAVTFLAVVLAFSLPLPLTLSRIGPLDWGPVAGGYLGALLLGAAYLAVGQFVSATTENQILAFILALVVCLGLYGIGAESFAGLFSDRTAAALRAIGTSSRFESVARGVVDLRDLVYYASLCLFFLAACVMAVRARRWT